MLTPYTDRQKKLIVNNVLSACRDIQKLKSVGYKFLYLSSGFIAHYNRYGFQIAYSEPGALKADILRNASQNRWSNFRPGDRDYEYYQSKADIYREIVKGLL